MGQTDYTAYGTARHSPRTFYSHHAAAISAAIVAADALTILEAAAHASYLLSATRPGPPPLPDAISGRNHVGELRFDCLIAFSVRNVHYGVHRNASQILVISDMTRVGEKR